MPSTRLIPTTVTPSVSTFTILSDGKEVSREHQVLSIIIHKAVNRIPTATLVIRDGDAASQSWNVSEADLFIPGKKIEIKAGYQGTEELVFSGYAVKHSLKVRAQKSVLIVECKDEAYKMTLLPRSRYFMDQSDSDVLEDIIHQAGLANDVESTSYKHGELVQYNCTDWDFILTRADAIGKICIVDNGEIKIAQPDTQQAAALTLEYGATLLSVDTEIDARNQFDSVNSISWSPADQALAEIEESYSTGLEAGNLSVKDLADAHGQGVYTQGHSGFLLQEELQDWSKARLQKSTLSRIRGRAQFQGIDSLLPGQVVELSGMGERFNGAVFLSAIRHEITDGNWVTDAELGLDDDWFIERFKVTQAKAGALIPAVNGLQIGQVTQLQDDPLGEDRIMVRLPLIKPEEEGIWARVACLDAGENRGSFFRPEINDEVLVGFLNNDPRFPMILGSLNSSAKPAPLIANDDNHQKGFVSRSGMKWLFDDEHNNILLETPDGNKVELSGEDQAIKLEDQHGNKITMDNNGITIESSKDILLKATAGTIEAEGLEVNIKANTTAEFSASGTTTIKGGLVQIN